MNKNFGRNVEEGERELGGDGGGGGGGGRREG